MATSDLADGESVEVQGSGSTRYRLKNVGGVYSCSCPAWRNQGGAPERRTCKHLRALRGEAKEAERIGAEASAPKPAATRATADGASAGEGVVPPPLLLAHSWERDVDLTGWWMSEKLDGVRAYWDGARLISRLGNAFHAPEWFIAALPKDVPLDGELFTGRKRFQRTVSIVRRQDAGEVWREVSYVVFDAPSHGGPFEERLRAIEATVARCDAAHVRAHPHEVCRGIEHLREELARVEALGGEGLMLRKPGSSYEVGRSSTLLKVKSFHDREARVVGHQPGAGRHAGRLGALLCELPDGTRFSVGTGLSDDERRDPPPIGAIITFRYQELSEDGVPRFPSYVGVRIDVAFPPEKSAPKRDEGQREAAVARAAAARKAIEAARARQRSEATRVFERDGGQVRVTLRGVEYEIAGPSEGEQETSSFETPGQAWRAAERRIAELLESGHTEID
jgi:DNA ligase-1